MFLGLPIGAWIALAVVVGLGIYYARYFVSPAEGTSAHSSILSRQEKRMLKELGHNLKENGFSESERLLIIEKEYGLRAMDSVEKLMHTFGTLKNAQVNVNLDPVMVLGHDDIGKMAQHVMVGKKMIEKAGLYDQFKGLLQSFAQGLGAKFPAPAEVPAASDAAVSKSADVVDLRRDVKAA